MTAEEDANAAETEEKEESHQTTRGMRTSEQLRRPNSDIKTTFRLP